MMHPLRFPTLVSEPSEGTEEGRPAMVIRIETMAAVRPPTRGLLAATRANSKGRPAAPERRPRAGPATTSPRAQ
ncbi:hypothetical protein B296_00033200, partial [Ensete ventricosum]